MATITTTTPPENLTGWTVTVPANWSASSGFGHFNIQYDLLVDIGGDNDNYLNCSSFYIGYKIISYDPIASSNAVSLIYGDSMSVLNLTNTSDNLQFYIKGGDTSHPDLIQWFVDNKATFSKEEEGTQADKTNNLPAFLKDLYEGIITKKPDASKNPQNFRGEIESIVTGITPTGTLTITENGTYPVTDKASVNVNVPIPALEGTAIPVGEPVERIYFNTNLTVEETNAYLSQLTYTEGVLELPFALVFVGNDRYPLVIWITKNEENYRIDATRVDATLAIISSVLIFNETYGWDSERQIDTTITAGTNGSVNSIDCSYTTPLTDFNGLPIGAENEKIKNVMSITPFVAEGEIIPEWDGSFTKSVNNLTGTTWKIPSGWKTSADQGGFGIEGKFTIDNTTINITALHLGRYAVSGSSTYEANTITVVKAEDNSVHAIKSADNTSGFTLKITGGVDVTNTYLATWLGSDGQDTTKAIISFTIDGKTYRAEHHMTWEQWVASDYNTDNYAWYQEGSSYYLSKNGDTTVAVAYDGDYVESADTIVSRREYVSIT